MTAKYVILLSRLIVEHESRVISMKSHGEEKDLRDTRSPRQLTEGGSRFTSFRSREFSDCECAPVSCKKYDPVFTYPQSRTGTSDARGALEIQHFRI